jgi:hypothetical protein
MIIESNVPESRTLARLLYQMRQTHVFWLDFYQNLILNKSQTKFADSKKNARIQTNDAKTNPQQYPEFKNNQ